MNEFQLRPNEMMLALVALADLSLGALVYWRYRAFRLLRVFAYNAFALAGYCIFVAGLGVIRSPSGAEAWVRALVFLPHLTVLTFFYFCTIFARSESQWTRLGLLIGGGLFFFEVLARATDVVPIVLQWQEGQRWTPRADPVYTYIYLPTTFTLLIWGWVLVLRRWIKSKEALERQQLGMFFVAMFSVILFSLVDVLPDGLAMARLGPLVYVGILAYGITRRNLFDIDLFLRRGAVQAAVATVLACVFVMATLLGRYSWGGDIQSNRFAAVIVTLVIALGYDSIKQRSARLMNRWLGEAPLNAQEMLLNYALLISESPRLDDFLQATCRRLCQDLGVEKASLWIRDRTQALVPAAGYPLDRTGQDPDLDSDDPRIESLRQRPRGIDLDSLAWTHAYDGPQDLGPSAEERSLRDFLQQRGFQAAFPLTEGGQLLGVLLVGPPSSGRPFKEADIGFLSTLVVQVATAVQNSLLHRQVQQADRLSTLGTLSASLAHEIRNPLTSISTFVQMLDRRHEDPVFLEKFVRIVTGELDKLTRLTEQLLTFARPTAARRTETDLGMVVERVVQLLHSQFSRKGVGLSLEPMPLPVWIRANEAELSQVLINLLMNGLQATPHGGQVLVQAQAGSQARLKVSDTGSGMTLAQQKRLFEPFFSTKEGGTGLGLTTCQRIVEEHGGKIEVESAPGEGTCFTLTFPAATAPHKTKLSIIE